MAKRKRSTFERLQRGEILSRRERKQIERQFRAEDPGWEIIHQNVAGIDVGNESHFVAVDPKLTNQPVREFGSWTAALQEIVVWLKECLVQRVVMQTTGVYWIPLQDVLEKAGFDVAVVDARGTKNLPGRKSDVQECQWIRKLDLYGLLRSCFQVPDTIRSIRTIWRLRQRWASEAARSIQQLQKALTLMNVQLANSISDLSGQTGMAILQAIVDGERNPWVLAKLRDRRIQASEEEIAHSLHGNWREDVLFELEQMLDAYNFQIRQIEKCELQLEKYMKAQPARPPVNSGLAKVAEGGEEPQKSRKQKARHSKPPRKNRINFDIETELARVLGADLTRIDGIKAMTIQTIYSELGPDLTAFPTENHFASWLMLAPKRDISGGKVIRHLWVKGRNRVANALRMAAEALKDSQSYLGARFRSLRGRLGAPKAIKAMARYLACLIYRTLMKGQDWVDRGAAYYEQRRQQRELIHLERKAKALGLQLVPAQ